MHGELMEFNEFLHRQLLAKDKHITRLQGELVDLRGPVSDRRHALSRLLSITSLLHCQLPLSKQQNVVT